ncbi:MAG TPA: cysteine--tRNA ligase [Mycobacteriales bacterium]|nr:cysteine--tRNA ligase [Mycobacteriales bacterium]
MLRLHDTRSRELRAFEPLRPGMASIYVCGPTVQAAPHLGHVRSAISFDILRRWLTASGFEVVVARNVTDIDDKILHAASHAGEPWWALAERNSRAFTAAYDALGVLAPTVEPRATGHVPQMLALVSRLIDAGHAYPSGGDVYFDVRSFPGYGSLSGQRPDAMLVTETTDPERAKRDPLDFALWKGAKPGEPAWDTPWGPGRPGWHLECSAMATHYLGETFDVHGGGLDLLFPHHENEVAQSAAVGDGFARYWLHNGMVNVGSAKMSKSVGNSLVVADVLARTRPAALRYALGAAHYRSEITWTDATLTEADAALRRLETFLRNGVERVGDLPTAATDASAGWWEAFAAAMDDDLAVPRALGVVHDAVREGNGALADGDLGLVAGQVHVVQRMLAVLGLDPLTQWPEAAGGRLHETVDALVAIALDARTGARGRRDFTEADRIRDALSDAGLVIEDTPDGPRWRLT